MATGKVGSAATTRGKAGSAASTTGEADGEGSDGGGRVGADPTASVLGRSCTVVKEVGPVVAATTTTTAPVRMMMVATVTMTTTATATPTPSPLLPGDHGMDFGRQRPRRGVATATGGACGYGSRRHHFEFFYPKNCFH
uniref:Uncharacterized protein n=1 Tax=Oryza glumipatula TaxID=40148 RepID=A0A0E0AA14_9ORYZ